VIDYPTLAESGMLADQGSLTDRGIGDILYQLWAERFTGLIHVHHEPSQLWIVVEEGGLNSVCLEDPDFRLGECLLRNNFISAADYESASKIATRTGRQLGQVLIEQGALAPEDLLDVLKLQVVEIFSETLNWIHGTYSIYLFEESVQGITPLQLETPAILFQASRRMYRWSMIRRAIPDLERIPVFLANDAWPLVATQLSPEENHLVTLCNGRFKISTVCEMSYLSSFETMRTIWILKTLDILQLSTTRLSSTASGFSQKEEPVKEPPDEYKEFMLQDLVQKYNEIYQQIVEPIVEEVGDRATTFIEECLAPIRDSMPERMKDVTLSQYGEIDFEHLYRNFSGLDYERTMREMSILLEDIFYALIYHIEDILPPEKAAEIRDKILKHHRQLN